MRLNKLLFVLAMMLSWPSFSQEDGVYKWPLDSPRVITGNYGELRPNHFHAGLDFSTRGRTDLPVYAVASGYVSRVKISPYGYGKCIYITHRDGKVSVYGHLNSLFKTLAAYVKGEQYAKKSFEVDLALKPSQFQVKAGQIIGLSGNSGSSTGPHLHFEIRDEKTEVPYNPLDFYRINDHIPPVIDRIAFYNLADTMAPKFLSSLRVKHSKDGHLRLEKDSVILSNGILGFAFSGYDLCVPNGNHNAVFSARLYLDNMLLHSHMMETISFDDARYVNEFAETIQKHKFQKCFLPSLYPAKLYDKRPTKGRILLSDTNYHELKLSVTDESGNESVLQVHFKSRKLNFYSKPSISSDVFVNCTKDFMISKNALQIFIPANTLFNHTHLIFENTVESTGKIIILPMEANLRSTSIIGFQVPSKLLPVKNKLVLKSGNTVFPPIVNKDSVFYSVKSFGWFLLEQDTVAPRVRAQVAGGAAKKGKHYNSVSFSVTDNLSGIRKYNLYIDNVWVLAEYDAKSDLMTYYFDDKTPPGPLNFKLEVEDRVGNRTVFTHKINR